MKLKELYDIIEENSILTTNSMIKKIGCVSIQNVFTEKAYHFLYEEIKDLTEEDIKEMEESLELINWDTV
jgi:hypothetical protein